MPSKLKQKVKKSAMKQAELAAVIGVKAKTVSRQCVTGIKTTRIAKRYAEALNCDWRELLD